MSCPMCPSELRNLFAVAHNLVTGWGYESPCKANDRIEQLRMAVEKVQPLVDAHFAH